MQRHQLAIDIAQAHRIVIKQREAPHAAPGQRLAAGRAHAAHAEHRHMRPGQPRQRRIAQQQRRAGKFAHGILSLAEKLLPHYHTPEGPACQRAGEKAGVFGAFEGNGGRNAKNE